MKLEQRSISSTTGPLSTDQEWLQITPPCLDPIPSPQKTFRTIKNRVKYFLKNLHVFVRLCDLYLLILFLLPRIIFPRVH